jgi:hypothetical protein
MWFEYNRSLQSQLAPAPALVVDPVFILGLWRSGTTYLHELLNSSANLISPATWQCMNSGSFRLHKTPPKAKYSIRPMDGLAIDTLSPQEDEFALLALGAPSVYRGFFDPRRLRELEHWLDPDAWSAPGPDNWTMVWLDFLQGVSSGTNGRLLLKSPNHTFRIDPIVKLFPSAKYVWLVRDPMETFLSNRKMWLSMFRQYGLWCSEGDALDGFLVKALLFAADCLGRAVAQLSRDQLVVMPFKRLTTDTVAGLEALNRRLGLDDWETIRERSAILIAARSDRTSESYKVTEPSKDVTRACEVLSRATDRALLTHGL